MTDLWWQSLQGHCPQLELVLELDLSPVPEAELVPEVAGSPAVNLRLRNCARKQNQGL